MYQNKPVQLPRENQLPREKIEKMGASALSNEELLALILGSGNQDCNVFELSRHLADFLSLSFFVTSHFSCGLQRIKVYRIDS